MYRQSKKNQLLLRNYNLLENNTKYSKMYLGFIINRVKRIDIGRENMRFVIQRVTHASVAVAGNITGAIDKGFLVLIGVEEADTRDIADKMIKKLIGMRIFEDTNGKTNLALTDVGGGMLLVSQFTLYADCKKGNRPSFTRAGNPAMAEKMYEYIIAECRKQI